MFAPVADAHTRGDFQSALTAHVRANCNQHAETGISFDGGTGIAGKPVIGTLFWVAAATAGAAADLGVQIVAAAVRDAFQAEPSLYEVTVIPIEAVALPGDPYYPPRSD